MRTSLTRWLLNRFAVRFVIWALIQQNNFPSFLSFFVWPADTLLIVALHIDGKEWTFSCLCHSSARLTVDRHAVICRTVKLLPRQTITSSWRPQEGLIVAMSYWKHNEAPPYALFCGSQGVKIWFNESQGSIFYVPGSYCELIANIGI